MIISSDQDFATTLARISAITLTGTPQLNRYRQETRRCDTSENQQEFEAYLHRAMGYKTSTVNDWA
jgi:hypothetical protein